MTVKDVAFSQSRQELLVEALAKAGYVERYFSFCAAYPTWRDIDGPYLDMALTAKIFKANEVNLEWSKRFKVFTFDCEEVDGWNWRGKLVV